MTIQTNFATPERELSVSFCATGHHWGDRHITATLDFAESTLHVIFSGNVYPLRSSFDAAQVGGNYGQADDS